MKKAKPIYNRTCVYTGRRLMNDGKVFQRFELPDGSEMLFRGVKGVWLGFTYKCGKTNISARPERVGMDRIDNAEWEAADALVEASNAKKRAEAKMRAKTSPALKAAVAALKPLCQNLDHFDRRALIELLANKTRNFSTK